VGVDVVGSCAVAGVNLGEGKVAVMVAMARAWLHELVVISMAMVKTTSRLFIGRFIGSS
jgi:hypothetical protein